MKTNLHMHTWRCSHADAGERSYIEHAIEGGLKVIGFSEHTVYHWDSDYYSWYRMKPEQMDGYVAMVEDFRREYARDIEIHLGLEVEYYPSCFDWLLRYLEDYPVEYMLLGQHFIYDEIDSPYMGDHLTKEADLVRYVDQVCQALDTGRFLYLAHPDLPNWEGSREIYEKHMRRLCQHAKATGTPLEINLLGIHAGRNYPNENFWKLVSETGNRVVLGSDAHKAKDVVPVAAIQKATELVSKYQLNLIDPAVLLR